MQSTKLSILNAALAIVSGSPVSAPPAARKMKAAPLTAPAGMVQIFRPAKGQTCILSARRQYKKHLKRQFPALASGRQWTDYRKTVRRDTGVDFLKLPTYMVKE